MKAVLRRRIEMGERVRDFLRAQHLDGPALAALTALERLLERATEMMDQQTAGRGVERGSVIQRAVVRRTLQSTLLLYLTGVGNVAAQESVELAEQFRLPRRRLPDMAFMTMTRNMLEQALLHRERLEQLGLGETVCEDIAAAVHEFEQTLVTTQKGRQDHIGATGDLWAVASKITRQVRLIEGLVRYRFGKNAELMGAWKSARRVGQMRKKEGVEKKDVETKALGEGVESNNAAVSTPFIRRFLFRRFSGFDAFLSTTPR